MSLTSVGPLNPRKRPVPGQGRGHFEAVVGSLFNVLAKAARKQLHLGCIIVLALSWPLSSPAVKE